MMHGVYNVKSFRPLDSPAWDRRSTQPKLSAPLATYTWSARNLMLRKLVIMYRTRLCYMFCLTNHTIYCRIITVKMVSNAEFLKLPRN